MSPRRLSKRKNTVKKWRRHSSSADLKNLRLSGVARGRLGNLRNGQPVGLLLFLMSHFWAAGLGVEQRKAMVGFRLRRAEFRGFLPIADGVSGCRLALGLRGQNCDALIEEFFRRLVIRVEPVSVSERVVCSLGVTKFPENHSVQ